MRRSAKFTAVPAVAVIALSGVVPASVAAAGTSSAAAAAVHVLHNIRRGGTNQIRGGGLASDTTYLVTSNVYRFDHHPSVRVKTRANGTFYVGMHIPSTTPLTTTSARVRVRALASRQVLASTTVRIRPPRLNYIGNLRCPGQPDEPVPTSFAEGRYTLRSSAATIKPHKITIRGRNIVTEVRVTLDRRWAHPYYPVTIVPDGLPGPVTHQRVPVAHPFVYGVAHHGQARQFLTGFCFNPGERVRVTPASAGVRGTATAGPAGKVKFTVHPKATDHRRVIDLRATSEPSGRSATFPLKVAGTTLRVGQTFGSHLTRIKHVRELRSPKYDYRTATYRKGCRMGVQKVMIGKDGTARLRTIWKVGKSPSKSGFGYCSARIAPGGNLVLRSSTQGVVWQSHTAGTGPNNRLVLRESGRLQLVTASGHVVWHSPADGQAD